MSATATQLSTADVKAAIKEFCDLNNLAISVEFVPWSKSRSATVKPTFRDYNLNWRVTVIVSGREVLTTDYSAGMAHCPSYKQGMRDTLANEAVIKAECETGFAHVWSDSMNSARRADSRTGAAKALPDTVDVVACLAKDTDVLDAGGFEDWASNLGYDTDSRKAEGIYRACLEIALKLRQALGDGKLAELRELANEW